jgi:hypothetical protein
MTEQKPGEQYEVVPNLDAVIQPGIGGDGLQPATPMIDEASKQLAMARMMLDNQKRQREQQCGAEIDAALQAILKKYKCNAKFMELREGGQTTRIWLQPVALDEPGG